MENINNQTFEPADGTMTVSVKDAGKILKQSGYKVTNKDVSAFVSLKDINKIYPNGVQAVYDFNIDIDKNDFIVLVGPSGCGKSTTLRMIAGLEDITSGYLYIDKVLSNYTDSKDRDISMVFQNYALYPQMTVFDNIAFPLKSRKYKYPKMSIVLHSWNQVLDVINNRIEEYVVAKKEANNKALNFGTINEYIATKLKISDATSKILAKYKINKVSDLDAVNNENITLKNSIINDSKVAMDKELKALEANNYSYDDNYHLSKDGVAQFEYKKMSKEEIRAKVFEAAEILDLGPYLDRRPKELSGGQMQRVALGRAIVRNAKLFLMDEPLSNLDAKLRVQMRSEIVRIHEQIGATTIYVTHDQTEAMTMATKIVVMSKGWVQQVGTPKEIYYNPKNIFVATFIGSPAMNIFNGEYNKGTLTLKNGYTLKLSKDIVSRHDAYYNEKIATLEEMLATDDFVKMHALKEVDNVLFKLDQQLDVQTLHKKINEFLVSSKNVDCQDELLNLISPFVNDSYNDLALEINQAHKINAKVKLQQLLEIVSTNDEANLNSAKALIEEQLALLSDVDINDVKLPTYFAYLEAVNKAIELVKATNDKNVLAKCEVLNVSNELAKSDKEWLLNVRRQLLTFDKIPSSYIGLLHNAQVFSKTETKKDDTLYYQKPKKKKVQKINVNLNSVDIEFVNNLYVVATNLLAKCKEALNGPHSIRVGIRPEDIHLSNEFEGNKTDGFNINADVVELLGSELLVHTNWADTNMIAKISTGTLIKPHSTVELVLNKDKVLIFDDNCGDTI